MGVSSIAAVSLGSEPLPMGDMPLAPFALTKRTEAELARAMAEHLLAAHPESEAGALRALRQSFPGSPLTVRVAALAALMRR
jgi:hypothetical protein